MDKVRLANEIAHEGIERVVYGKDLTTMREINRILLDALQPPTRSSELIQRLEHLAARLAATKEHHGYAHMVIEAAETLKSPAPEEQAMPLLRRALVEMRRWKSCQNIGTCRNCADDGFILQLGLFLEHKPLPQERR